MRREKDIFDDLDYCLKELAEHGGLVDDWLECYLVGDEDFPERKKKMLLLHFLRRLTQEGNEEQLEEFDRIRELGEQAHRIMAEDTLYKKACSGEKNDFRATQTLLERRNPDRWSKGAEKKAEKLDPAAMAAEEARLLGG